MGNDLSNLQAFYEPQERLDRLIGATFRRFGPRVVDLSYANVYDGPAEEVLRALELSIRDDRKLSFQYTPYGGSPITRRLIASSLSNEYGLTFTARDVVMTPGAMAGLNIAFRALFGADDEVIVLTPCWHDYPLYLHNLGIPICLVGSAEDKHLDLAAIRRAVNAKTKGILFSQPCCPTGVLFLREEIDGLAEVLREAEEKFRKTIYLLSDEVHRNVIWSQSRFYSPLMSYPRSLSIYSFGKALSLQGQRVGYVAVSPRMPEQEEVRRRLERCVRIMGFCTPTNLMQRAICRLLDYRPSWAALAKAQETVRTELTAYGYQVCKAESTFFVYVKSPITDDFKFAELLASYGVLVVPSTLFYEGGYIRLSLTACSESIADGLPAFAKAQETVRHGGDVEVLGRR